MLDPIRGTIVCLEGGQVRNALTPRISDEALRKEVSA